MTAFSIIVALIAGNFLFSTKLLIIIHYLTLYLPLLFFRKTLVIKKTILKYLIVLLFFMGLFPNFLISTDQYKKVLKRDDRVELVNQVDLQVAKQIEDETALVISDPLTMIILEALTMNSSTGGVYTPEESRIVLWKYLNGNVKKDDLLEYLTEKEVILVITPRTEEWRKQDVDFIRGYSNLIWSPQYSLSRTCNGYESLGYIAVEGENYCILRVNENLTYK